MTRPLAIVETHPVQYHAPVYRAVQALGVPVVAVYGSDFSIAGYEDREFATQVAWDTDLLGGYSSRFLSRTATGGPTAYETVRSAGLGRILQEIDPAAVLLLGYRSRFDRGAIVAALRTGRPLLFRGETTDHAHRRSPLKRVIRDQLLRCFYARCSQLLYIGQQSLRHFQRLGCPESKLVFSPYCVDTAPFRADETARDELRTAGRAELEVGEDRIVLLFAGKLAPRKGPDLLVAAVRQLPADLAGRIVLAFLGNGALRAALEGEAARTPAVAVRFVGFRNQTQLSRYYHAADLLVLPSRESETWGLVVNEALHHGVPCVVSDRVGSALDLIQPERTGVIFPAGAANHLAAAVVRGIPLIGRSDVRQRCRTVAANYSVAAAAVGVATAYRAVVSPEGVPPYP